MDIFITIIVTFFAGMGAGLGTGFAGMSAAALFKGKISKKERMKSAEALAGIEGHPLNTFMKENLKLRELIEECKKAPEKIQSVREVAIHYAKKGDLIYPLLDVKYNISGPSAVMWTTDVDLRTGINRLCKAEKKDEKWREDVEKLLTMLDDMIYKEENILFPNCAVNFSEEDWQNIYMDSKDYDVCFGVENATWDGVKKAKEKVAIEGDIIKINGGTLSLNQLEAMLNPRIIIFFPSELLRYASLKNSSLNISSSVASPFREPAILPVSLSTATRKSSGAFLILSIIFFSLQASLGGKHTCSIRTACSASLSFIILNSYLLFILVSLILSKIFFCKFHILY